MVFLPYDSCSFVSFLALGPRLGLLTHKKCARYIFDFDKSSLAPVSRAITLNSHIRSAVRSGVRRSSSRTFESAYGYCTATQFSF